ncbi:MAG TPA: hypothetical protein VM368_05750 [Flavisolibacter sp.]|nr:hypothetical protein [Flavisolibacter sp.]
MSERFGQEFKIAIEDSPTIYAKPQHGLVMQIEDMYLIPGIH